MSKTFCKLLKPDSSFCFEQEEKCDSFSYYIVLDGQKIKVQEIFLWRSSSSLGGELLKTHLISVFCDVGVGGKLHLVKSLWRT